MLTRKRKKKEIFNVLFQEFFPAHYEPKIFELTMLTLDKGFVQESPVELSKMRVKSDFFKCWSLSCGILILNLQLKVKSLGGFFSFFFQFFFFFLFIDGKLRILILRKFSKLQCDKKWKVRCNWKEKSLGESIT